MTDWQPIKRGSPEVEGVSGRATGLLRVHIPLDRDPPREWEQSFLHPAGINISLSMHPPKISGDEIIITPPDSELEEYVRHVDERIRVANEFYSREVVPRMKRHQEAADARRADEERRLREARDRAKK